jgi:uncharacterized protein (TIGR02646 family)
MRPVNRGLWPTDDEGNKKQFSEHREAQPDLIDRLGEYCSYCERPIDPDIEHKLPKQKEFYPELECDWNNFLLACKNCNSTKGAYMRNPENCRPGQKPLLSDYYWPDSDNTAYIFEYQKGGLVTVNPNLSNPEKEKAEKTLELTGLYRYPGNPDNPRSWKNKPKEKFKRWTKRINAWKEAEDALNDLKKTDTTQIRELIIKSAKAIGFFSVWMTVFRDDPDMLKRFIKAFPGTAKECFDEHGRPLPTVSRSKPVDNPALTQKPRYEIADVIPLEYETSILDWLERSGRLMERDNQDDNFISREEEIAELIENDSKYDDDDDEESL